MCTCNILEYQYTCKGSMELNHFKKFDIGFMVKLIIMNWLPVMIMLNYKL